ncbi:hypothetical protein TanjilG_13686 [Lupinus angustifolius]|uniref:Late embryogenesis abundant protein LEA-2 subgroup domain-containing protein n=1 Tax=Lupinus angustifolius TaxID=3871 RepID=A0A1J7GWJ3_LUPAN|nr:PREDICTED: late embryogenesis abundant protein At1g64065 [Lupinus angustifolius]OIW04838.1 hypothetical protein TanjilG_13686 [Lupinus angustifolius]
MAEKEQVAPIRDHPSNYEGDISTHPQRNHQRKFINSCVCLLVFLLLLAIVIIVLIFTIFRVKEPIIRMNSVQVTKLELANNMSLIADVSVKNPNFASFRYSNTTTTLYYHGIMVGEARGPSGHAKARGTITMNVTVELITKHIISSPNLSADLGSRLLTMSSFSSVPGQVKILKLFKKHVVVKMNCTMSFNITTQGIQELDCKSKVKL